MGPAQHVRSMLIKLTHLEDRVLARNPEEAARSERREEMLTYLMTDSERFEWRRTRALVTELRKLI